MAIERCADLLNQDDGVLRGRLSDALLGQASKIEREPGMEAASLFRIYFRNEQQLDIAEYRATRERVVDACRQCAVAALLAKAARSTGTNNDAGSRESGVVSKRDEVLETMTLLAESRERLLETLSKLMHQQLDGQKWEGAG